MSLRLRAGLAALCAAALLAWAWWPRTREDRVPATPAQPDVPAGQAGRGAETASSAPASIGSAAARVPDPAAPRRSVAAAPGTIEVCGVGAVPRSELESLGPARLVNDPAMASAAARLRESLGQGSPIARAAALLLQAETEVERRVPLPDKACVAGDAACLAQESAAEQARAAMLSELGPQLARLDPGAADADTAALAQNFCRFRRGDAAGDCGTGLLAAWAAADAGNAMPWLHAHEEAMARGDLQAADEAMYRASRARFVDDRSGGLLRVLGRPEFAPEGGLPALYAASRLLSAASTMSSAQGTVYAYCRPEALRDANRRLRCDELARLLAYHDRSLFGRRVGYHVGKRLGWPEEELDRLDKLFDAGFAVMRAEPGADMLDLLTCEGMRRARQRAAQQAELGEFAYWERRISAAGRPVAELASGERTRREREVRQIAAELAKSNASAPDAAAASAPQSTPR